MAKLCAGKFLPISQALIPRASQLRSTPWEQHQRIGKDPFLHMTLLLYMGDELEIVVRQEQVILLFRPGGKPDPEVLLG